MGDSHSGVLSRYRLLLLGYILIVILYLCRCGTCQLSLFFIAKLDHSIVISPLHPRFEPPRMNQVTGVLTVGRLVTVHVHVHVTMLQNMCLDRFSSVTAFLFTYTMLCPCLGTQFLHYSLHHCSLFFRMNLFNYARLCIACCRTWPMKRGCFSQ